MSKWCTRLSYVPAQTFTPAVCSCQFFYFILLRSLATGRDASAMEQLSTECNKEQEQPLLSFAKGDVADSTTVSEHFRKALDFFGGRCDVLVANAGTLSFALQRIEEE